MVDAIGRLEDVMVAPAEEATSTIAGAFDQVGRGVASSIGDMVRSGEVRLSGFADFVDQTVGRILDRMVQMAVVEPLAGAFSTGIASAFAPGVGAGAGATASPATGFGGILGFAKGGVVDGPTVFPFARGVGLMGEAGPEAILPLTRLAGGDLGVRAELGGGERGGAGPVKLEMDVRIINNGAPLEIRSTRESTGPDGRRVLEVMVENVVDQSLAKGRFDRSFGSRFGLRPAPR